MKKHRYAYSRYNIAQRSFLILVCILVLVYFIFVLVNALQQGQDEIDLAGMEIRTNVDSAIYLDRKEVGFATNQESFIFTKISDGEHVLKIADKNDSSIFIQRNLIFQKGTKVLINWNFGVSNDNSSGVIKYFVKKSTEKNAIRILPITKDAIVSANGVLIENGRIENKNTNTIEVSKSGYLSMTLEVSLPTEKKYVEYDLVVEIALFQIPFS